MQGIIEIEIEQIKIVLYILLVGYIRPINAHRGVRWNGVIKEDLPGNFSKNLLIKMQ
jgi:hypothetical protein